MTGRNNPSWPADAFCVAAVGDAVPAAEKPRTGSADPAPLRAATPITVSALTAATEPPMRTRKVFHAGSWRRAWRMARLSI